MPSKLTPVPLGEFFPFTELFNSFAADRQLQMLAFEKFGAKGLIEMYILMDGKHSLADIRDLLSFEFGPVGSGDVIKLAKALEEAKLITLRGSK